MTLKVVVTCETFVDVKGIIESAGDIEVELLEPFTEHEPLRGGFERRRWRTRRDLAAHWSRRHGSVP